MKWFDEWFYSKARWAWKRAGIEHPEWKRREDILDSVAEQEYNGGLRLVESETVSGDPHDLNDGLRIDIKKLNGGYVVTFRHPHTNTKSNYVEDSKRNSYIITEDVDFNERLGKLLTMELLK